jgi:Ser/Thr protein kinase RdoA (MazF antagonist)
MPIVAGRGQFVGHLRHFRRFRTHDRRSLTMLLDRHVERVLRLYPPDCQALSLEAWNAPTSFSGARLWCLNTDRGELCLRRFPPSHPDKYRLEFIQAVLWHVRQEGFCLAPLPIETMHRHGYVPFDGHLWELTPWLPGSADFAAAPSALKLENALRVLAEFHCHVRSFPLPEPGPTTSPGIAERRLRLQDLIGGGLAKLQSFMDQKREIWPEMAQIAPQILKQFGEATPRIMPLIESALMAKVRLIPAIRDIWSAHVLYQGDQVSGIVDYASMRPESAATDVARLLGSTAGDDRELWQRGLAAYQAVCPMNPSELGLIEVFDLSSVLLSPIQWLHWIYVEDREFGNRPAVVARCQSLLARLTHLSHDRRPPAYT